MNGEDLRRVKCLAEHIHSTKLTAEDPIGISCLRRAKETFIVTLEQRKRGRNSGKRKGGGDEMDSICLSRHWSCLSVSFLWSLPILLVGSHSYTSLHWTESQVLKIRPYTHIHTHTHYKSRRADSSPLRYCKF